LAANSPYHGWGAFDARPFAVSPATDLNGDNVADVILAARHQACVLAISGRDGKPLWLAARGHDLAEPVVDEGARWRRGVVSGVVAVPTPGGDVDGDGVADMVVLMAEEDRQGGVQRWLESLSGRTGQTLWRRGLEDRWFAGMPGMDIPESFRWFKGSGAASSRLGDNGQTLNGGVVRRDQPRLERVGYFHHVPSRPVLAFWQADRTRPPRLTLFAGSQLLAFDALTGEPMGKPFDCGLTPGRDPLVVDVDGDGADELVVMQEPARVGLRVIGPNSLVRIGVVSLVQRRLLWTRDLQAEWPRPDWPLLPIAAPRWPVVADLDGDGRSELIVPNGSSRQAWSTREAWGELEVLEGTTGVSRWKRRLKTMDQQLEHVLAGPDIDGDGVAEVFAVTLWSPDFDLYVDALSGRDGQSLWVGRKTLRKTTDSVHFRLTPPLWWQAGRDGWPQLVVPVVPVRGTQTEPLVCVFSAGTGEVTQAGSHLIEFQATDADGDGIEDLFAFDADSSNSLDAGGTLVCFRGQTRELWKSIGSQWSASADLDGDGVRDLMRKVGDGSVAAASGRDGRPLWTAKTPQKDIYRLEVVPAVARQDGSLGPSPLMDDPAMAGASGDADRSTENAPGDFDRDGTIDLLAYINNTGRDRPITPVFALSGRTGRTLWSADIAAWYVAGTLALDVRDLDGDGLAEVVWVGASDWEYPEARQFTIHQKQLRLAVLSGRNGRVVWRQPLSKRYGLTPQTTTSALDFVAGWVALSYGDLNADGVLDLLVPAEAEAATGAAGLELRALNGRTGDVLWRHALPAPREELRPFSDIPPPAVTDLDGDGQLEVVALNFAAAPQSGRSAAILEALEGTDGRERWSCQWDVSNFCGRLMGEVGRLRYQPRPLPLRVADGTRRICLNLWDSPERVVVLDSQGQTVSDFRLETQRGFHRGPFRVWSCDGDGDGNDELLLANRDHLIAVRPERPDQPRWQRETAHLWSDEIEGVLPGGDSHRPQVVVRRVDSPGAVFALDASTGKRVWTTPAPALRGQGHEIPIASGETAILGYSPGDQAPWLLFQHQFVSCVREAPLATEIHAGAGAFGSQRAMGSREEARLAGAHDDPRQLRPLPWFEPSAPPENTLAGLAWCVFYSVCLLVVPGAYVIRSCRRRHWSLKWFLLAPAVAALPLTACMLDAPDLPRHELLSKILLAAVTFPALVAIARLAGWAIRRRWRPLATWLGASVVVSAILAATVLVVVQSNRQLVLQPGERYAWDGWWFIWLYGAYLTAWLLTLAWLLAAATRRVRAGNRRATQAKAAV
jgi:outer membrane protein assembly factor BamB